MTKNDAQATGELMTRLAVIPVAFAAVAIIASNWLLAIGLAIAAPTILAVLFACLYFTRSPRERLVFLVMGCVGVVATVFGVGGWCARIPNSWPDRNLTGIVLSIAPFGALAASIMSVAIMRRLSRSPDVAAKGIATGPSD